MFSIHVLAGTRKKKKKKNTHQHYTSGLPIQTHAVTMNSSQHTESGIEKLLFVSRKKQKNKETLPSHRYLFIESNAAHYVGLHECCVVEWPHDALFLGI